MLAFHNILPSLSSSARSKNWAKNLKLFLSFSFLAALLFSSNQATVIAVSQEDRNSIYKNTVWYKPNYSGTATDICAPDAGGATANGGNQTGGVFLVGDSIGTQITGPIESALSSNNRAYRGNVEAGRTLPGGIAAITPNQTFIGNATVAVVQLGTNAGGFTNTNVEAMVDKLRSYNANISIYWVDTVVAGRPAYTPTLNSVNQVIYDEASRLNYTVISWAKEVFGSSADPTSMPTGAAADSNGYIRQADEHVHLTPAGISAMSQLVLTGINGGGTGGGGTTDLANCACAAQLSGDSNAERVWNYLIGKGLTPNQTAGIMGNLRAEAGFEPRRVEYAWSDPPHLSDIVPPNIGPQGQPGYGIVQWTSPGRKQGLRDLSASRGVIAGDLALQLDYLWQELSTSYADELRDIRASTTLADASYIFLSRFEVPANIPGQAPIRVGYGQTILEQFGSGGNTGSGGGSSCGAPVSGSAVVGDIGLSSNNVACAVGTNDLGIVETRYTGAYKKEPGPLIIRLCQVPDVPGQGNNTSGVEIGGGVVVNSRVSGAWRALGVAAKAAGISLFGTSSFRLADSCGGTGTGGSCATPGGSPHQMGVAIDFYDQMYAINENNQTCSVRVTKTDSPQWRWMYKNADRFGFEQYSAEAWHWDPLPSDNRCSSTEPSGLVP